MSKPTLNDMRLYILDKYSGLKWKERVYKMKPNQVAAIYKNIKKREALEKENPGVGTVEVLKPIKRTNFDKILNDNKEFLKDLIKRDCCIDPQSHKIMRCQPFSQCKYCMFGKDKGDRFECNTEVLEKWLDEEVKE